MKIEEIKKNMEENNVSFIRLQFIDLLGIMKNVEVPITKLNDVFANKIMFDGSSIEGFVRINESDMYLAPDINTYVILPWENGSNGTKVASFMCDILRPNGKTFEGDPRGIMKKALKEMKKYGFKEFKIGLEPEFFLFKKSSQIEHTDNGGYFDLAPLDNASDCRRDIVIELQSMGFDVEASHHEVSPSQHEINFKYNNALEACDRVQLFKLTVKNIAARHGMIATFMPKPIAHINGSGMHANLSLFNENGENTFYDSKTKNQLSETANYFIGGLIKYAKEYTALTNPTVNSYKRLTPGYEAPCYIAYSDSNRSAMIRIPNTRNEGTRVEVRSVDATANPYLAMAALLTAGLEGIKKKISPRKNIKDNIFKMTEKERKRYRIDNLPVNLQEAVNQLKKSELMKELLGKHIFESFIKNKYYEYEEYSLTVHDWEIKNYRDKY